MTGDWSSCGGVFTEWSQWGAAAAAQSVRQGWPGGLECCTDSHYHQPQHSILILGADCNRVWQLSISKMWNLSIKQPLVWTGVWWTSFRLWFLLLPVPQVCDHNHADCLYLPHTGSITLFWTYDLWKSKYVYWCYHIKLNPNFVCICIMCSYPPLSESSTQNPIRTV